MPLVGVLALAIGISDERQQFYLPGRQASLLDLGADMAGVTAVLGMAR